jgi:DNA repair protein RecN (Recombination protein N)
MITELRIKNFAIIHQLNLQFADGLVIFTGETGAGKSIIMDALEAVLGGRAETASIRTGTERAQIEAVFRITPEIQAPLHHLLAAEELLDDPEFVTLSREIRVEGPNTARINGHVVTASLQRALGAYLVDIHGQSEHLSLLHVRNHLYLLDSFANVDALLENYQVTFSQLQKVRKDLASLQQSELDAARRVDMLTYQIQEIEAAKLTPGEEEEIRQERTRLANAESLANYAQTAQMLIEEGSPESPGISELLGQVVEALNSLSRIDVSTEVFSERAESNLA